MEIEKLKNIYFTFIYNGHENSNYYDICIQDEEQKETIDNKSGGTGLRAREY